MAIVVVGVFYLLARTHTVTAVGMCHFTAHAGITLSDMLMLVTNFTVVLTVALTVNMSGDVILTITTRGMVVFCLFTGTGAVTVGMDLQTADGRRSCRGGSAIGITWVFDVRGRNTFVGVGCTEVEPVVVYIEEVVNR